MGDTPETIIKEWLRAQTGMSIDEFNASFTVKIEEVDSHGASYKVTTVYNWTNATFVDWFTEDLAVL